MYEITVEGRFSAAHRHPLPGRAPSLHGHDFLVLVRVRGADLQDDVLVDFHDVETRLKQELARLGHRDLSGDPELGPHATPAVIARWLYRRLEPGVPALASVEVRDGENTGARYGPTVSDRQPARG